MAKIGKPSPRVTMNSPFGYEERKRQGCVQGSSDLEYGMVSGFQYGLENTGNRTKLSSVGRKVKNG
jgi:hypothetical protein